MKLLCRLLGHKYWSWKGYYNINADNWFFEKNPTTACNRCGKLRPKE